MHPYRRNSASAGRTVETTGIVKLEYLKQQPHKTHTIDGIIRRGRVKNCEKATEYLPALAKFSKDTLVHVSKINI